MYSSTRSLVIALILAMTSLACAQEEQRDPGQTQDQMKMTAHAEQHPEGEGHVENAMGHSHESAELHGGAVVMTPKHHFEVVFAPKEVRIYGYDGEQKPINEMNDAKASLTLQAKDGNQEELALHYVGPNMEAGRSQGYFATPREFGEVADGQMKATFVVSGMGEESIKFKTSVRVSNLVTYACPMHPDITGEDSVACSKCGMALTKQTHGEDGDPEESPHSHEGHDH